MYFFVQIQVCHAFDCGRNLQIQYGRVIFALCGAWQWYWKSGGNTRLWAQKRNEPLTTKKGITTYTYYCPSLLIRFLVPANLTMIFPSELPGSRSLFRISIIWCFWLNHNWLLWIICILCRKLLSLLFLFKNIILYFKV